MSKTVMQGKHVRYLADLLSKENVLVKQQKHVKYCYARKTTTQLSRSAQLSANLHSLHAPIQVHETSTSAHDIVMSLQIHQQ
jgi:hypothetical protein